MAQIMTDNMTRDRDIFKYESEIKSLENQIELFKSAADSVRKLKTMRVFDDLTSDVVFERIMGRAFNEVLICEREIASRMERLNDLRKA